MKRLCMLTVALAAATPALAQAPLPPGSMPDSAFAQPAQPPALFSPGVPVIPTPPDFPRGRLSGYTVGDAFYNASGNPAHLYDAKGADAGQTNIDARNPVTRDLNGIQVRRIYVQVDNDLSIKYAARVRLEVDGKSLTTDGKLGVFVKNAYLQARSVIPRGDFYFGMLSTPTWENAEEFWQYRAIEKTIGDFWGIGSASDLGLELKGFVDGDHHVGYAAMIGDGNGQKPESDRFKKLYLGLPMRFGDLRIEPYADYQSVRVNLGPAVASHTDSLAVNADQATTKLFVGYEFRRIAVGAEALARVNHKGPAANQEARGGSLFARASLTPTVAGFARFDLWQPDHNASNRVDSQLWIAGLDWQPFRDVHVMPNVEATRYVGKGTRSAPPHHDLQARVTFYYRYSRPQS